MNNEFDFFEGVKEAINNNNKLLKEEGSYLYSLYLGFCKHLYSYLDAYKLLFNSKNYYVCRSIDRAVIDLYLKARVLTFCKDPEKVAKSIVEKGKIPVEYVFGKGKGFVTDTALCKYFDLLDNTYSVEDTKTGVKIGLLELRYKESSGYVHPNLPCVWSYTTDDLADWSGLIEDDKIQFVNLVNKLMVILRMLFKIIQDKQKIEY